MSESQTGIIPDYGDFYAPHELHVTVAADTTDPAQFLEACDKLGVKPHIIYNELPNGEVTTDYLTGSALNCTSSEAREEVSHVAYGLRSNDLEVVREKIETIPWHPASPKYDSDPREPGSYFESHFIVPDFPIMHNGQILQFRGVPFYISTTDNKRREHLLFATMRHYESTAGEFCSTIGQLYIALAAQVPEVKQPTIEFSLYDSNPDHDREWVDAYQSLAQGS